MSASEIGRLRGLHLAHLLADLRLSGPGWREDLARATGEAAALGVDLELALHLGDQAEAQLRDLATELAGREARVARWVLFHERVRATPASLLDLGRACLHGITPGALLGGGTDAAFCELNRQPLPPGTFDFLCYSISPQVHASDDLSIVENLEAQAHTVRSARTLAGGAALSVGPVTLKRRFNADATGAAADDPAALPSAVDVRQMSLLGAGWTLGSLAALASAGSEHVTYYETTGWRGVMEQAGGPPRPDLFPSWPGCVYPLYHVLADVGECAGSAVGLARLGPPRALAGLVLARHGRRRVLVANLTPEAQPVDLGLLAAGGHVAGGYMLAARADESATAVEHAMREPEAFRAAAASGRLPLPRGAVRLPPYAICRVDVHA